MTNPACAQAGSLSTVAPCGIIVPRSISSVFPRPVLLQYSCKFSTAVGSLCSGLLNPCAKISLACSCGALSTIKSSLFSFTDWLIWLIS